MLQFFTSEVSLLSIAELKAEERGGEYNFVDVNFFTVAFFL